MRVFKSNTKNYLYFLYRIGSPVFDPIRFYFGIKGYVWFMRDMIKYKKMDPTVRLLTRNLFPMLNEKTPYAPFDAQYFYQQLWVFEHILKRKPKQHIDIGSTYAMSGYISKITKAVFVDLRPIKTSLKNLKIVSGDILKLPFRDNSLESLSCLHVVEHIGLGRYGDPIDPDGTKKACLELVRALAKGGYFYFSVPLGRDRICFNAHRVHSPQVILKYFNGLKLLEFSVVDDYGNFYKNVDYKKYGNLNYGCGFFLFTKQK